MASCGAGIRYRGMIEVYKDGVLVAKFDTLVEAMEYADADAEICGNGKIKWVEKKGSEN